MSKPKPLLRRSALTGNVYVITAYKDTGNGLIEVTEKYDVTDQFNALLAVNEAARESGGETTNE